MAGSNFVDYVKIFARSGHGGAGSAHFRREKFVAFGGPDGGDGGKGGSIVLQGDSQYWTLIHLKYQRHQFAEDGQCGSGARSSGRDARDIVIPVPLGTVARRVVEQEDGTTLTEDVGEVTADGEQLVLLKGGRGGLGNWHFKSATNQTPRYAQPGEEGEEGTFILELKVLADVGLLGMPNAGKSTFIAAVSNARPKIADYPFTTLVPNLGVVSVDRWKSFVVADIPGLIEGASEGAGLGIRFLKHLSRTRLLLHLVDMAPLDDTSAPDAAEVIVNELTKFSPSLAERDRWLVLNKCDSLPQDEHEARVKEVVDRLEWTGPVYVISAIAKIGTDKLCHDIMRYLEDRADRLAADPAYKQELAELDQRIEDEARAQLQALDDKRALRRSGVKSVHDIGDDDWDEEDVDDEDGPEIIYVRD